MLQHRLSVGVRAGNPEGRAGDSLANGRSAWSPGEDDWIRDDHPHPTGCWRRASPGNRALPRLPSTHQQPHHPTPRAGDDGEEEGRGCRSELALGVPAPRLRHWPRPLSPRPDTHAHVSSRDAGAADVLVKSAGPSSACTGTRTTPPDSGLPEGGDVSGAGSWQWNGIAILVRIPPSAVGGRGAGRRGSALAGVTCWAGRLLRGVGLSRCWLVRRST